MRSLNTYFGMPCVEGRTLFSSGRMDWHVRKRLKFWKVEKKILKWVLYVKAKAKPNKQQLKKRRNFQLFFAIRQKKPWRLYGEIVLYTKSHYSNTSTSLKICFPGDFHEKYLLVERNDQTLTTRTWQSVVLIFCKLVFFPWLLQSCGITKQLF